MKRAWALVAGAWTLSACHRSPHEPGLPLELRSARGVVFDARARQPPAGYDPIALAASSVGQLQNPDPTIPPPCYTRTAGTSNPCWTCHTRSQYPNLADDWELQQNYAFPETAMTNPWRNQFRDRRALVAGLGDEDLAAYIRTDNYGPLRAALAARPAAVAWRPDLDLAAGFDDDGFARDGSGWRAVRYKPFPGLFWPTAGSADDVYIRLPAELRRDAAGQPSRAVYQANLAILEAAIAGDPRPEAGETVRAVEDIDEVAAAIDLDRDGRLAVASTVVGLPATYAGGGADVAVVRGLYPVGVELFHTVRYLDPDAPGFASRRLKEVRYARKVEQLEGDRRADIYTAVELGHAAPFTGDPLAGLRNPLGWQLQGWIEDARGWLRLQTHEEQAFCMGCHGNLGVTADHTFAFARKVPGRDGWRVQDPRGIEDRPQLGHARPEYATYLERLGGGDGAALEAARADIAALILPTRARAFALDRAYLANVIEQSYVWGRDAVSEPVADVHATIGEDRSTGIGEADRTVRDGRLHLAW